MYYFSCLVIRLIYRHPFIIVFVFFTAPLAEHGRRVENPLYISPQSLIINPTYIDPSDVDPSFDNPTYADSTGNGDKGPYSTVDSSMMAYSAVSLRPPSFTVDDDTAFLIDNMEGKI